MTVNDIFLGFDPSVDRDFGVAVLHGSELKTATVSSVADAIAWAILACGLAVPLAAGIDTLLHWSDGPGGWRPADRKLRAAYPPVQASVLSPNGLYGSMSTGGMVLALRLRQQWPSILLNETHPKVLAFALRGERHRDDDPSAAIKWFAQHSALNRTQIATGHELDAALSAWATREGLLHGWTNLVTDDLTLLSPAGTTTYLWPQLPTEAVGANLKSGPATERRETRATTSIGYLNRNQQEVIRATSLPSTDHGQRIYVLRCSVCGYEYGDNGSGIFQRRCPKHDVGAPGQAY